MTSGQLLNMLAPGGLILLGFLPVLILLLWMKAWVKKSGNEAKSPIIDNLLRHPGQSAQEKSEELRDKVLEDYALLTILPGFFALMAFATGIWVGSVIFAGICIYVVMVALRLRKTMKTASDYALGAKGERAVAQSLDAFKALGAEVFHDLQMDGYNIDHVVVTTSAVFCVETKTRRKPTRIAGAHKLIYKNGFVRFTHNPQKDENFSVEQSRRQARQLGQFLTRECKETVETFPILTFPGWWVEEVTQDHDLLVCNPKMIVPTVKKEFANASELHPILRKRIIESLREKATNRAK